MRHHAGVHQRSGGIAIFVAEIGADQLLLDLGNDIAVETERGFDLRIARHEDRARLPVARLEIAQHELQLDIGHLLVEREHAIDDAAHAPRPAGSGAPIDRNVERTDDDPRGIGLQTQRTVYNVEQAYSPALTSGQNCRAPGASPSSGIFAGNKALIAHDWP
jgi:hypothetical protein